MGLFDKIGKIVSDAAKGVTDAAKDVGDFVSKTAGDVAKAVDQNGDGKLDFSDIQSALGINKPSEPESRVLTEEELEEECRKAEEEKRKIAEAIRKADYERLKPLFPEDVTGASFVLPKLIRVAEIDKEHAENDVCKGAVGFRSTLDDMTAVTIFRNHVDIFGLKLHPEIENGLYYADPGDRDKYIALDEYFSYMKEKRVTELQQIAQMLGATHFKVVYMERDASAFSSSVNVSAGLNTGMAKVGGSYSQDASNSSMSAMRIEAELRFRRHDPIRPVLKYLKNDININNLIDMRMDPNTELQEQRFSIEMSRSSGIRLRDAVKIDAMIKLIKANFHTTIESEAQNEARRVLEYEIEF